MLLKKKYRDEENSSDDINIYSKDVRELLLDDDELTPTEEAFMNGYEDAAWNGEKMARYICINCATIIMKSAHSDPHLCRNCERLLDGTEREEKYAYLDNY